MALARATLAGVTAPAAATPVQGDTAAVEAAWRSMRASADIQFAPVPPDPPAVTPEWLKALGRFLEWLLSPLARLLGSSWSAIEIVLLIGACLAGAWLAWALVWPLWQARKARAAAAADGWAPEREQALALLEDADRLAAQGLFADAVHLLLRRSVGQIAQARPDWLTPSSTAREIGALRDLPEAARSAFATIAGLVERARYALRPLGGEDWHKARDAYASFALEPLSVRA